MSETSDTPEAWDESDSQSFIQWAGIIVPARAEQMDTLLGLIPARQDEAFTVVELASGEGALAEAVLERFPRCRYVALDRSATMREQMARRLAGFGERLEIRAFDLAEYDWRTQLPAPFRCVLSSLSVHHLPGEAKRRLFADLAALLEPGGALLLADLVEPATSRIAGLFARQYDDLVRQQSLATLGDLSGYERFRALRWNYFTYDYGSAGSGDYPSPLNDQLLWLREAGFSHADCFWLRAGHAVYGGFVDET